MNFDKAYITDEGASILAASLNNEYTIQWGNVYTTNVDLSIKTEPQIHALTLSDFPQSTYTSSGTVQNVLVNRATNIANVYSEINNSSFNGTAKSFIVLAKFPSDQNYSLVMVAYCDQATPTTVPSNIEPFIAHVNFNVEVSDHSVSTVTNASGWYASNDAFQNLANRVVTTHSLNDSTTGENQNILGNKTFKNNLIATSILPETHSTSTSVGNDIGSDSNRFRYAYIRGVNAADVEAYEITSTNLFTSNGLAYFNSETRCTTDLVVDGEIDAGTITCYGDLNVDFNITVDGNILPKQPSYSSLGSSQKIWDCVYTLDADVKEYLKIDSYSNTDSTIAGLQLRSTDQNNLNYILISGNTSTTASSSAYSDLEFRFVTSSTSSNHNYFRITTSYTTNGDIVTYPSINGKWDLGKVSGNNSYKLNRVYANEFIGHASTANGIKYTNSSTGNVIYASSNTTIVPNGNDVKLGDFIHKFDEIHSNKLIGCIPTTELNTQSRPVIQVGSIFLAIVHKNSSGQTPLPVGTEITPYSDNNYDIFVAEYNNASGYWDRYGYGITSTSGARYKLLNALNISSSGNTGNMAHIGDALALMMRIS
jgi:hypothetical protein